MEIIANRYRILDQLLEDSLSVLYKAFDQQNNQPVAIKLFNEKIKQKSLETFLYFKREMEKITNYIHPNLINIYEIGEDEGLPYIAQEFVEGGFPLSSQIGDFKDIDTIVEIMLQISSGLDSAHQHRVIHHTICPSCILLSRHNNQLHAKIFNFAMWSLLDLARIVEEKEIVKTFGYMSPEATGILRKPVDERSDIYSLGIIFYQLVTGQLPYEGRDISTLIHQHIAQKPPLPTKINSSIPEVIERIILQLIAKDPVDRYQTVTGLIADLKEYLRRKTEGESTDFVIARSDRAGELTFSTRFIGREKELKELQQRIDESSHAMGSVSLVYGEPGVGKSRLLDELRGYIHSGGGIFIGGRSTQSEIKAPYLTFSEVINDFVEKIKRRGKRDQEQAVKQIKESVGELGQEVVKIAPSVVSLIGEQPELVTLEPEKERIRFLHTVTNFIVSLGTPEMPVVVFLDDFQWTDEGSLELFAHVAEKMQNASLVFIIVYRDTDIEKEHPLIKTLRKLRAEKHIAFNEIKVPPFSPEETREFISQLLMEEAEIVIPLAEQLYNRTGGNPFFILELFHALVDGGIVYFQDNHYQYDLNKLEEASLPTNIVDVVLNRIKDVAGDEQKLLSYASVMGREIVPLYLVELMQTSQDVVLNGIEEGIRDRFLIRDLQNFERVYFVHERIREAFYTRIQEDERESLHAKIGTYLEEQNRGKLEPVLYDLAYHFTQAKVEDKTLQYSMEAGKKAQAAYVHDQAIRFYGHAKEILEKQKQTTSDTYVDLLENLGVVYKGAGRLDKALDTLRFCEQLIPKRDRLRRADIISKIGDTLWEKGEGDKAIEILGEALKSLGVKLPRNIVTVGLGILKEAFIQGLHTLFPRIFLRKEYKDDPKAAVVLRILVRIAYFYYFTDLNKMLHTAFKMLNMGERLGPCRTLSNIYSAFVVIWSGIPLAVRAKKDGERAIKIAQDLNDKAAEGCAYAYHAVGAFCNRSIEESYEYTRKSVDILKGIGEYWDLGMARWFLINCGLMRGEKLDTLLEQTEEMILTAHRANSLQTFGWGLFHKAHILAIIEDERLRTEGIKTGEDSIEALKKARDNPNCLLGRSFLAFAFLKTQQYNDAIRLTEEMAELYPKHNNNAGFIKDVFPLSAQIYLDSAQYKPGLTEQERAGYLKKAGHFCNRAFRLSKHFPYIRAYSFQVNGTYQWLTGNKKKAIETWEKGIAYLREHTKDTYRLGSILMEEASFILKDNPEDKKARDYLFEAKEIFVRLGARLDAERIKKLSGAFAPDEEIIEAREALTQRRHSESLLSVTKAIGSIFNLEELLENIMDYAIKVTGAERGFLFLYSEKQEGLTIQVKRGVSKELQGDVFSYEKDQVSLEIIQESEKTDEAIIGSQEESTTATVFSELTKYGIKQAMCIPLQAREKKLGFIYIDNSLAGGIFGSEELELMKLFAVQASVSIENAYLVNNLVEQERLKQEMELGWQIQSSLLPQEAPRVEGLYAEGFMQPAKEIGGDYYDFIPIANEQGDTRKLGIVIADISGKGIDAGMVMSITKSYVHGLIEQNLTTREAVLRMNNHLCLLLKKQKFVSMIYAEYSLQDGTFTWSGAGHTNFLIVRNQQPDLQKQENEVELIMSGGIILGLFDHIDSEISQQSILLNEGDRVILYTDGVTEAKNANNELFTQNRLIDILKHAPPLSSRDLISYINEKIDHHIGNTPQSDDITIIVMERKTEVQIVS